MNTEVTPQFGLELEINNLLKPQTYIYNNSKGYLESKKEYIISYLSDGVVLSRYGDDIWNVSPYSRQSSTILYFEKLKNIFIREEAKKLVFLYYLYGTGRYETGIKGTTLLLFYNFGVKPLAIYAESKGLTLKILLENSKYIKNYISEELVLNKVRIMYTIHVFTLLKSQSHNTIGINYIEDKKNSKLMSQLAKEYTDNCEQTEVIPLSIYTNAAEQRWKHITRVKPILDDLFAMIDECLSNIVFARERKVIINKEERIRHGLEIYSTWDKVPGFCEWKDAVKKYRLIELFDYYQVTKRQEAISLLGKIQTTCRHLKHMNTGMRESEGRYLGQNCYLPAINNMPPLIQGHETKINGKPTAHKWVTVKKVKLVIDILIKIGNFIVYRYCPNLKNIPLSVSTGFLNGTKKIIGSHTFDNVMTGILSEKTELPLEKKGITITQTHIDEELSAIEPLRNWSNHKWIKVNKAWHFNSHQYRRSLAVYALGSGLVSVYTLKEQFGHLLKSMTEYYGNGSLSAKQLEGKESRNNIANYMKKISTYLEAASFIKNVSLSREQLFGGGGVYYDKYRVSKTPMTQEQVFKDLTNTLKQIKKGQLRYISTAVGGCTSVEQCNKYLFPSLINFCKDCDHGVLKISKIEALIERQREMVIYLEKVEKDSIQYRTEVKNLLANEHYIEWLKKKAKDKEREEKGA